MPGIRSAAVVAALAIATAAASTHAATPPEISDAAIVRAIEAELISDMAVPAHDINIGSRAGIVTMSGSVDNLLAKRRAVERAEQIKGVRSVIDRIDVTPRPRPDGDIRKNIESALARDPATESFEFEVSVESGVVTLTGRVESFAERNLAIEVAQGVRGVKRVAHEIEVVYGEPRMDDEIEAEIERRLQSDTRVDAALVTVDVENGVVKLGGVVGSANERTQTRALAWTSGVRSVDDSELRVEWWARDRMRKQGEHMPGSGEIKRAIQEAFRIDPRVNSFNVQIDVTGTVVTLTGVVKNLAARRAAEKDALNTFGVWRVKNLLRVRPGISPSDEEVRADVARALERDPLVNRFEITPMVRSGVVYLVGHVDSGVERRRAEHVVARVKGVVDIRNDLQVTGEWEWKSDWEIRQDIEDQLQWSPLVDDEDIRVLVADGVATLTGTVASWSERNAAVKNAYEGGAKRVFDQLDVADAGSKEPRGFVPPFWRDF